MAVKTTADGPRLTHQPPAPKSDATGKTGIAKPHPDVQDAPPAATKPSVAGSRNMIRAEILSSQGSQLQLKIGQMIVDARASQPLTGSGQLELTQENASKPALSSFLVRTLNGQAPPTRISLQVLSTPTDYVDVGNKKTVDATRLGTHSEPVRLTIHLPGQASRTLPDSPQQAGARSPVLPTVVQQDPQPPQTVASPPSAGRPSAAPDIADHQSRNGFSSNPPPVNNQAAGQQTASNVRAYPPQPSGGQPSHETSAEPNPQVASKLGSGQPAQTQMAGQTATSSLSPPMGRGGSTEQPAAASSQLASTAGTSTTRPPDMRSSALAATVRSQVDSVLPGPTMRTGNTPTMAVSSTLPVSGDAPNLAGRTGMPDRDGVIGASVLGRNQRGQLILQSGSSQYQIDDQTLNLPAGATVPISVGAAPSSLERSLGQNDLIHSIIGRLFKPTDDPAEGQSSPKRVTVQAATLLELTSAMERSGVMRGQMKTPKDRAAHAETSVSQSGANQPSTGSNLEPQPMMLRHIAVPGKADWDASRLAFSIDDQDGASSAKAETKKRFVVELELTALHKIQLDCIAEDGRFDLVVRHSDELEAPLLDEIYTIFYSACSISGVAGRAEHSTRLFDQVQSLASIVRVT